MTLIESRSRSSCDVIELQFYLLKISRKRQNWTTKQRYSFYASVSFSVLFFFFAKWLLTMRNGIVKNRRQLICLQASGHHRDIDVTPMIVECFMYGCLWWWSTFWHMLAVPKATFLLQRSARYKYMWPHKAEVTLRRVCVCLSLGKWQLHQPTHSQDDRVAGLPKQEPEQVQWVRACRSAVDALWCCLHRRWG